MLRWARSTICSAISSLRLKWCSTAQRRVINGETVPNDEKIFSIFETHTQLYRRGKQAEPNQFGRLVMVYEDGAGFISHYYVLPRDSQDADVVVEQTRIAQKRHRGQIEDASAESHASVGPGTDFFWDPKAPQVSAWFIKH